MSSSSITASIHAELSPGKPPMLRAGASENAPRWASEKREALLAIVAEHGALMIRGLGLESAAEVEAVFRGLGDLISEKEGFAPRQSYARAVYSASKWPPNQPMCMHHELSYALEFPGLLLFACLQAPAVGGATLVADSAAVLKVLPDELVERLERTGWNLVRNYNGAIGASVLAAFGTDDRKAVEDYCRAHAIRCEWQRDGTLRTRQRRSAILTHPLSGLRCWFNQVAFLSEWTMDPEVREYLVDAYGEEGLPFSTRFGDGGAVGPDVVRVINQAYEANTMREPWQAGDVLLVDNIRTAHGREPFHGQREVLVAMADVVGVDECSPTIEAAAT